MHTYTIDLKPENFTGRIEMVGKNQIEIKPEQQIAATFFIVTAEKSD